MRDSVALMVAVVSLAALGVGVAFLTSQISVEQVSWARLQYLFGAIEAIAFAAAGWLWGKEVHRDQAAAAGAAQQTAQTASKAQGNAEGKLETLADAVIQHARTIVAQQGDVGGGPATSLTALAALATQIREDIGSGLA